MNKHDDWRHAIDPSATAFFLDVDGTLVGFKERPEDVVADEDLLNRLRRLWEASGGAVALISGRAIDDLDRIMSPVVLPAGGVHGSDLRFADGRRDTADAAALADVREAAAAFVAAHPGLRLEDKGATIAIHYRQAPHFSDLVSQFLDATVVEEDLMVQHGKMVAEVKSRHGDKGTAIATLMRTPPFEGRTPLFIGDDLTDEHGLAMVNALDGWSIKVGHEDEVTVARHRLADVQAVHDLLDLVCRGGRRDQSLRRR